MSIVVKADDKNHYIKDIKHFNLSKLMIVRKRARCSRNRIELRMSDTTKENAIACKFAQISRLKPHSAMILRWWVKFIGYK